MLSSSPVASFYLQRSSVTKIHILDFVYLHFRRQFLNPFIKHDEKRPAAGLQLDMWAAPHYDPTQVDYRQRLGPFRNPWTCGKAKM